MRWIKITSLLILCGISASALAGPQPKVHSTSTTISCTPDPVELDTAASCTATVTDLGGQGPDSPPQGEVSFSSDSTGTFSATTCTLSASGAITSSCSVTYTPTVFGSGTHTITGDYSGGSDPNPSTGIVWSASSGSYALSLSYPAASITDVTPSIGLRGETVSVTVTGDGFVSGGTTLNFGANITQSNFTVVSRTQITVDLTVEMAAATGDRDVTVTNSAPGGGSDTLVNGFRVENPAPVISSLSPAAVEVGSGAVTVTIDGTGFVSDSTAYFDGNARTTTFVNSTQLQMDLTATDTGTIGDYSVTVQNPPPGGGTSNSATFSVVASGGSFDAVEPGDSIGDPLYLKLAGTTFDFDILATDVSRSSIDTDFTGTVKVELLDAGDDSGALDSNGCRSSWGVADTLPNQTFSSADNGRITVSGYSYSGAIAVARFRITYPETGAMEKQGCSSDAFSIRPTGFTFGSTLNNGSTSGNPTHAAGDGFTMTVDSVVGYDGTPQLDATQLEAHADAVAVGTVGGTFDPADAGTGSASGTFTYSEVGAFRYAVSGVYDDTFTAVDQPDDCTDDFSNTLAGGLYGCKIGNAAATQWMGRFIPDHFDVTLDDGCTDAGGFTYSAQPFDTFSVIARNASGVTTQNYDYMSGDADDDNNYSNDVDLSFSGSSAEFSPSTISFMDFSSGVFSSADVSYTFADPETTYTDVTPRATDTDGVSSAGFTEETSEIRSGRMIVSDATSATILDAVSAFAIQTWQETSPGVFEWANHADDSSCTSIVQADFSLGNYTGDLDSGETSISAFSYTAPTGTVTLSAPGAGNSGTVDLTADLATRPWLRFDSDSDGTVDDPEGRISFFDIFTTEDGFIDRQEIIQ